MFNLPVDERLSEWINHRRHLEETEDPLQDVWDFWHQAPFIPHNRNIDPYYQKSWPSPWEIIEENKLKNKVSSLEDYALEIVTEPEKDFNNAMGQESLTRFDQPTRKKKNNKKRKPSGDKKPNSTPGNGVNNNPRPAANKIIPVNRNEPKK
jgi:hypothetical protein